ncbi:MAG: PepSY-like domain-containing protein [Bacteroidota bacterium]|nr:PepSY-like domain-containing protein [Bacteroidota bacterium]
MKTLKVFSLLSVAAILLPTASTTILAQEKKISEKELPAAVLSSFHKAYPKAEITGASTETEKGKKYFEIESMDGSVRRDLLFTSAGTIAEIEETIPSSELPGGALQAIEKKISGAKVNRAEKVISGSRVSYELSVTGTNGKYGVILNKDGKIIKSRKMKSSEEEED